jgi:hypothetical protein
MGSAQARKQDRNERQVLIVHERCNQTTSEGLATERQLFHNIIPQVDPPIANPTPVTKAEATDLLETGNCQRRIPVKAGRSSANAGFDVGKVIEV